MKNNNENKTLFQQIYLCFKSILKYLVTFCTHLKSKDSIDLLPLYYIRLQSTFEHLSTFYEDGTKAKNKKNYSQSLKDIQSLLNNKDQSWNKGNVIEQKMVSMMDVEMLDFEIERKLLGSKRYFDDEYIKLYKDRIIKINKTDETKKKRFLLRLIQDIQWQIRKRKSMEPSIEMLRKIMMFSMLFSILCTLSAYRYIYTLEEVNRWYFILVISAGFMGTIFSMLISVAKHSNELIIDNLQNLLSIWHIGAKIALGVGAALLFYYFFQSKLIPLGLFPDINQLDKFLNWKQCGILSCKSNSICLTNLGLGEQIKEISEWDANLYKLIIWSFLAGFSEQLVPDILNKTKSQINNSA